jgi:predicted short-subunit dehydrogenase-like oxidoreductase (DUF2520 family)
MADEQRPAVTILGRGRVGTSLARALTAAGIDVTVRSARDEASFADGCAGGELVLLAVPDGAIGDVAERVGRACVPPNATGATTGRPSVVHLSGASGFGPLRALAGTGFSVGIAHPVAAFPEARGAEAFRGVTFGVAASSPELVGRLEALVTAIGAVPRRVDADGWVAYHAAAVIASNHLVVLASQASALLEQVGFDADGARDALVSLMRGTLDNLAVEGVDNALSGPLRRGDVGTVERHLTWLDEHAPDIAASYRAMARPGIDLALGTGLDPDVAERLRRALG